MMRSTDFAHLAQQNHLRRLSQRCAQGQGKVWSVGMKFALVNRRVVVLMEKLYRVFDGDDVIGLGFVNPIDDRRQRRTLAAARRPGHQHDSVFQFNDLAQLLRQVEIFKARRPRRNYAHDDRMRAALFEDVDAKAAQTRNAE